MIKRLKQFLGAVFLQSHNVYRYPIPPNVSIVTEKSPQSHKGIHRQSIDFLVPEGTPVLSASNGYVIRVVDCHNQGGPDRKFENFANFIIIKYGNESVFYCHLRKSGALVNQGDFVRCGQVIAIQGSTGWTDKPHLHFCVYRNGHSVKPRFLQIGMVPLA